MQPQARSKPPRVDDPREVRRLDATVPHRPGDAEARLPELPGNILKEGQDDLGEARVALTRVRPGRARLEDAVRDLEPREARVRAPDVAGEDQLVVYQRRPSWRISSSAAAGPQDPAG